MRRAADHMWGPATGQTGRERPGDARGQCRRRRSARRRQVQLDPTGPGLARPTTDPLSSRKMLIGGVIYMVRLLELDLDRLDLDETRQIRWPAGVDDIDVPPIHGALVLCDLKARPGVESVPRILRKTHT